MPQINLLVLSHSILQRGGSCSLLQKDVKTYILISCDSLSDLSGIDDHEDDDLNEVDECESDADGASSQHKVQTS